MRRRRLKIALISFGIIVVLLILGRIAGLWNLYMVPTQSNAPNMDKGDFVIASSLIPIKKGRFIFYEMPLRNEIHVKRLVAVGGDVVEIRKGDCFINGKPEVRSFPIRHRYLIPELVVRKHATYLHFQEMGDRKPDEYDGPVEYAVAEGNRIYMADLNSEDAPAELKKLRVTTMPARMDYNAVGEFWNNNWTIYDFGPLKVPEGRYFVLGDNRDNSVDSRHLGFLRKEDIIGTLVW